ncbi:MAG: DUF4363 family protein [Clostridia bacterium]|nr:DUF4363 family protein [Clostridia bacterium]
MIRTIISIFISLALLLGITIGEGVYVQKQFALIEETIQTLYEKTEDGTATHEDGEAVETFWQANKKKMHMILPHTAVQNIDFELNEALGYLYQGNFQDALPKMEVLLQLTEVIRQNYSLRIENVL